MAHFKTFSLFILIVTFFMSCKGNDQPRDSCKCSEIHALREKVEHLIFALELKQHSCNDIQFTTPNVSVQNIYPFFTTIAYSVLCDARSPTDKWTVIQRRFDGSQDFFLGWHAYKRGFGDADSEYWLGLDVIHEITANKDQVLRVELEDYDGNRTYAEYSTFVVGPESDNYRLKVNGYSGNAGDALSDHENGMMFSTFDRDNDVYNGTHCAKKYKGGWWYNYCFVANLNGLYFNTKSMDFKGMNWLPWKGSESLREVTMMIKKRK